MLSYNIRITITTVKPVIKTTIVTTLTYDVMASYVGKKVGALFILALVFRKVGHHKCDYYYRVRCDCGKVFLIHCRSVLYYKIHACSYCRGKKHNREKY